jgi:hypothetical protein
MAVDNIQTIFLLQKIKIQTIMPTSLTQIHSHISIGIAVLTINCILKRMFPLQIKIYKKNQRSATILKKSLNKSAMAAQETQMGSSHRVISITGSIKLLSQSRELRNQLTFLPTTAIESHFASPTPTLRCPVVSTR